MAGKPRTKVPKTASAGEVIKIKSLITHPMESGHRKDKEGNTVPRMIINKFECTFNGETIFSCDIHPGIAANPYLEFRARVEESGTFKFIWTDDEGTVVELENDIEVT